MELVEAVVGTAFLSPVVYTAVVFCGLDPQIVIALAAVLALPIGWLMVTFERFLFTLRGRYESYLPMKFIRNSIEVTYTKDDKQKIDLKKIMPKDEKLKVTDNLILDKKDFDLLFDPYKELNKSRILFWKPFRFKQHLKKEKLPFVENIENILFFFENPDLAEFIRGAVINFHTYLAAFYALVIGCLFSIGFAFILKADTFLQMVSKVLPLTYAVDALRKVMILGVGIEAIIMPITILIILGVVTMTLGVPLFDRAVKR